MSKSRGNTKHGMHGSPEYWVWCSMKKRCSMPSNPDYKNYGGRGISYDPAWDSFEQFYADMGPRTDGCSLDRIDNDGDYCKENCRWTTRVEQGRNKRNNIAIVANGKSQCPPEWAEELGMSVSTIYTRLERGWLHHDIVNTPVKTQYRKNK